MDVRYLRNTSGEYVAFLGAGALFTPAGEWLGVLQGEEVYDTAGQHVGRLWADGRLVRRRSGSATRAILPPRRPLPPVRPLPPKRGLFLPAPVPPEEDVFEWLVRPLTALPPLAALQQVSALADAVLLAADGAFLGRISRERDAADSLGNPNGAFGSPHAERSIFNEAGRYGAPDAEDSPYHRTSATPPRIVRDGVALALLSVNPTLAERVDPNALVAWLAPR